MLVNTRVSPCMLTIKRHTDNRRLTTTSCLLNLVQCSFPNLHHLNTLLAMACSYLLDLTSTLRVDQAQQPSFLVMATTICPQGPCSLSQTSNSIHVCHLHSTPTAGCQCPCLCPYPTSHRLLFRTVCAINHGTGSRTFCHDIQVAGRPCSPVGYFSSSVVFLSPCFRDPKVYFTKDLYASGKGSYGKGRRFVFLSFSQSYTLLLSLMYCFIPCCLEIDTESLFYSCEIKP